MATGSKKTDQMHGSMSHPATLTGSGTSKMKGVAEMHSNEDHMMSGGTGESGHDGMMKDGSGGEMSH
jgi:hypothetical protein